MGGPCGQLTDGSQAVGVKELALVLKSGNFGGPDFFREAIAQLEQR